MENKNSKSKKFIDTWFIDKKKRYLATFILILPFLVIIGIFGLKAFNEAKTLIGSYISEEGTATKDEFSIGNGGYILRDNATEIQKTYFKELKDLLSNNASSEEIAASIVKNYVADFYTFSNKQGQYDVGGMYYVYKPQRYDIYYQARDQFYKYINNYIDTYGNEALLEVESVEASATNPNKQWNVTDLDTEENEFETSYSEYLVDASWTYVTKEGNFDNSKYETSAHFIVIDHAGRYEIVYVGSEVYNDAK